MHDYDAYSDEELDDLLPDGPYQAEILEYHYTDDYGNPLVSRNGDKMVKVKVSTVGTDRPREMIDFILLNKQWAWKYKHLCDSIGRVGEYMNKTLKPEFFPGAITWIEVGRQEAKNGYRAKNTISDYIKKADQPTSAAPVHPVNTGKTKVDEFFDDSIPF